jgi:hypothetical protein
MAEPVSRQAWTRLVTLLNVYVRDGAKSFSNAGPLWNREQWTTESCGLNISTDWSFPHRISRAMVKSMFEWSKDADDLYRSFCAAMVWVSERESRMQSRIKPVAQREDINIGEIMVRFKETPTFDFYYSSELAELGPVVGSSLMNLLIRDEPRAAVIDAYVIDWMWEYGQINESWQLDLDAFTPEQFERYSAWCTLVLNQFRNSGHLPDHCDDLAFVGYLMSIDRMQSLISHRFADWAKKIN